MVIIEHKQIQEIPILHVIDQQKKNKQLPLVIFMHGFTSVKENNLHYAYLLANKGIRVVLPEAAHHGERANGLLTQEELMRQFWKIVIQSIHELPTIKQYFEEAAMIRDDKIGLVGTSMGGIVTLGALTQYDWIKSAVSLMGVPSYRKLARLQVAEIEKQRIDIAISHEEVEQTLAQLKPYDLSLQPEKLKHRSLLFWHGKKDPVVPYTLAFEFYNKLKQNQNIASNQLQFITDEHAGHKVSREGVLNTVNWFTNTL